MPLSALHRLLRKGKITVDGAPAAPSTRINTGQTIEIPDQILPNASLPPPSPCLPAAYLSIIYEDSNLLILNKPPGVDVHGPASLEEDVRAYLEPKLPPSLSFRPGPLHRLDKPTSGGIAFSVSLKGAQQFSALLREGKIRKEYLAVLDGTIETEETWEDSLVRDTEMKKSFLDDGLDGDGGGGGNGGAKKALTRIKPLARAGGRTLVRAEIATGRTHQIRAQAAARGYPLSGDRKYGGKPFPQGGRKGPGAFFRHAGVLEVPETPPDTAFPRRADAPLPADFALVIKTVFVYTDS
jgi:23S rRNA pseudouridine955/2504/2580 synthase